MRRALAAALLLLLAGALVLAASQSSLPSQVYTVAQVATGLARHPAAWVGRTILVRGMALEVTEWIPPARQRHAARTAPLLPVLPAGVPSGWAGPGGWVGASLVTSPTPPCISYNEPCQPPLVGPLRAGTTVYVLLFDRMPDLSQSPTRTTTPPPMLTLLVQGPSPTLDAMRHLPVLARWAPRLR